MGGRSAAQPAALPSPGSLVARVLPDVAGIDKEFDYLVPDQERGLLEVGSQVRIDLSGRRVGGWVTALGIEPAPGLALRPIVKRRGVGPDGETLNLAAWAAWYWAGRRRAFLRTASAGFAVPRLAPPALRPPARPEPSELGGLVDGVPAGEVMVLRLAPASDPTGVVAELAQRGPTLVIVPTLVRARVLATRLRRAGGEVALMPDDWAQARAGAGVVIGSRAAAWAPCPGLAAVVVLDGHDESLVQEQAPTWNAVAVVAERARRAAAPCVVVSPCPSPELLVLGSLTLTPRGAERKGWAPLEVVDRRGDDPRLGLYSERLVTLIRSEPGVVCVLNRTGRARLLSCASCGALARCERCGAALGQEGEALSGIHLHCSRCGLDRPSLCAECHSTRLKVVRAGVSRAREDLERLAGRPVAEVTGATGDIPDAELVVGTEAVLRRLGPRDGFGAVVFVDFDQELLAGRVRAATEALALLALASRLVRGRAGRILVQTRIPDHPVVRAAVAADPAILSDSEEVIRRQLELPPFTSIALVAGPGAAEYVEGLRGLAGSPLRILGPDRDEWLLKAPDGTLLAEALNSVPRPAERLRVAVDPARI
jgi:primosomal protein N' (replication factor Y) (superfamily II helicase)